MHSGKFIKDFLELGKAGMRHVTPSVTPFSEKGELVTDAATEHSFYSNHLKS